MRNHVKVHILRVFVNEETKFGNPVGIVLDEKQNLASRIRQTIASKLGFSETVFINDLEKGQVSIFNPIHEVKFAGHALVGTAYFINKFLNKKIKYLNCEAGQIQTWQVTGLTWIRASLTNTPSWQYSELKNTSSVDSISESQMLSFKHTVVWAWKDKDKGIIRARTFAPDWGIPEDEANGSGSMQLAAKLGRNLEIHHGKGSVIYTKPDSLDLSSVGGRVKRDSPQNIEMLQFPT